MTKEKGKSRMPPWIRGCLDEIDSEKNMKKKRKDEKNAGMREIKKAMEDIIILFDHPAFGHRVRNVCPSTCIFVL